MGRSELSVWSRSVRRALRDWVRDQAAVPSVAVWVSAGSNPRRLRMVPAYLLTDSRAVHSSLEHAVLTDRSRFAAYGALMEVGGDQFFGLVALDGVAREQWVAPASAGAGLGAWQQGGFVDGPAGDLAESVLREVAASG